jgi:hypothetical protein
MYDIDTTVMQLDRNLKRISNMATVSVYNAGATFLLLSRGPQKYGFMKNVIT